MQAFEAVRQGNQERAQSLLFSPRFMASRQKPATPLGFQRLQLLDTLGEKLIKAQKKQVLIVQFLAYLVEHC